MIKAVLWDVDGTLLNFLKAEEAGMKNCFAKFGLGELTEEMMKEYSAINAKYWQILERGEMTKPQILTARFEEFFGNHGLDTSVAPAFNEEYQLQLGETICFEDNAKEVIESLKGTVIQCAVTNGTRVAQERKLAKSGLDQLFDHIFISEVIGAEKPNQEFFDAVFAALPGIAPSEIMIVGDSLTSDIRGGVNAGLVTCWYNPQYKANDKGIKPDYEIAKLPEAAVLAEFL